jgi:hypothetical protein
VSLCKDDRGIVGGHGDLVGQGPQKGDACPGAGHHDWLGVLPPGAPRAVACAAPDVRGIARRPGAFDECASSLGVPRRVAGWCETWQAVGGRVPRPARGLEYAWRRRGRPAHCREPAPGG